MCSLILGQTYFVLEFEFSFFPLFFCLWSFFYVTHLVSHLLDIKIDERKPHSIRGIESLFVYTVISIAIYFAGLIYSNVEA